MSAPTFRGGVQDGLRRLTEFGIARLPFADAATKELPLGRLLRLGLFQVSVGMALTLMTGTLNRVMIVELAVAASLVSVMISLPMLAAPARALIGFKSDQHRSAFGWRRVPYIWRGTMLQFAGLAILPFSLVLLNGDSHGSLVPGRVGATLAFILIGAGAHTVQTAGLALATDLADDEHRPRVVALMYVMLLAGTLISALFFGTVLRSYSNTRLVQVVQGAALLTLYLNVTAIWKQEARNRERATAPPEPPRSFAKEFAAHLADRKTLRLLVAVAFGTLGFNMQDILLEPYGGQVLGLSVGQTTLLTAMSALGALAAFALAARRLQRGGDPARLAALGGVVGLFAFAAVIFSGPVGSPLLFRVGSALIGFGGGLFGVGTLTVAMSRDNAEANGLAVGAWGAAQATAGGLAVALGGVLRDVVAHFVRAGSFGAGVTDPMLGYTAVYFLEILALLCAIAAIGPLAAPDAARHQSAPDSFGLAELPG